MREDAMPGEALLSNGTPAENNLKAASQNALPNKALQDMAEKLEKSEAGRKKLRQAISMLKEKVETNEKVLQVNEVLRQECEKQRLRADAERNRAEEEKKLREEIEKEGLSTKEQLVRVLQRLDAVERNWKSDRNEVQQMRKETKQAVSGLSGVVKAIEVAHLSFEGLEKNLVSKVSNAVSASTKSSSLAQTAITDAKGAQGTAVAAEKLSHTLVTKVSELQKQGASLDQRMNLLQQDLQTKLLAPLGNELNACKNRFPDVMSSGPENLVSRGVRGSQGQPPTRLMSAKTADKDRLAEDTRFNSKVGCAEMVSSVLNTSKTANRDSVAGCGSLSPKTREGTTVAGITGMEMFPDTHVKEKTLRSGSTASASGRMYGDVSGQSKLVQDKILPESSKGDIVRQALDAAKQRKCLSKPSSASKVTPQPATISSCQRSQSGGFIADETEVFRGRMKIDSGNGSMPAILGTERNEIIENSIPVLVSNHGSSPKNCSLSVKKNVPRIAEENGAKSKVLIANPVLPGKNKRSEMVENVIETATNGHKKEKLPVLLLKDITKLFQKEKKSHVKMEQKLAALERVLQIGIDSEGAKKGLLHISGERHRKRKRRKSLKTSGKKKVCLQDIKERVHSTLNETHTVATQGLEVRGEEAPKSREVETSIMETKRIVIEKDPSSPLPLTGTKSCQSELRSQRNDAAEEHGKCIPAMEDQKCLDVPNLGAEDLSSTPHSIVLEGLKAAIPGFIVSNQGMDIDAEMLHGGQLNGVWDSDSETSEDGLGDDWLATKRVLLSPSLPEVLPPLPLLEVAESSTPSTWPGASEMSVEEIDLFLNVLPPIEQEACDQGKTEVSLTNAVDSKLEPEDLRVQLGITGANGEDVKDIHPKLAEETLSCLLTSRENFISNTLVHPCERGLKPLDKPGDCEEENKENVIGGYSVCGTSMGSSSRPISSALLLQEANLLSSETHVGLGMTSTFDSATGTDDMFRDSQDAMKLEEKVGSVQSAAMDACDQLSHPYSLELVWGHSCCESEMNSSGSAVEDRSLPFITERSTKIFAAFGSTQKILHAALSHTNSDALGSSLAIATEIASISVSSNFSELDFMCIFTASLVDSLALWDNEKTSTCLTYAFKSVQLLIQVVNQVLITEAFQKVLSPDLAFATFAAQLQKFVIQGSIHPVYQLFPEEPFEEASNLGPFFHFTAFTAKGKRLEALISGSKLLATFCETTGKLPYLRNSVYLVLRFCDMDSLYLLATIFSFACVCSKSLFSVNKEDIVGQAVHVVISELLNDAEVGRDTQAGSEKVQEMVEFQLETPKASGNGAKESSDFTQFWGNLFIIREVISKEDGLSFEAFVPKLLESFHVLISSTFGTHVEDNRHLFQRRLQIKTCKQIESKCKNLFSFSTAGRGEEGFKASPLTAVTCSVADGSANETEDRNSVAEYYWRFVRDESPILCSTLQCGIQPGLETKLVDDWEQRFYDVANAVELVASHLGWEWTYNDLIVEHLWKLVAPGAPAMTVACVAYLFGLLGSLGREVDNTELPGVDELRKSLLVVLNSDSSRSSSNKESLQDFSFRAQVAAAQSLLVLSSFKRNNGINPSKDPQSASTDGSELQAESAKALQTWVKAFKPQIQNILPLSLRSALLSVENSKEKHF